MAGRESGGFNKKGEELSKIQPRTFIINFNIANRWHDFENGANAYLC